ncbi:MAG: hypothetical protein PHV13_05505, partial [Candidatus ainarchaeum sp.]|nr:hypothetical protein [Candidatus ainarchaeum sp.]
GHAIEFVSNFGLYHGEAVALGIRAALYLSFIECFLPRCELTAAEIVLTNLGMPKTVPASISRELVEQKLANDKKVVDGVPYFVRIESIGQLHVENSQYATPIPKEALACALDYIFG